MLRQTVFILENSNKIFIYTFIWSLHSEVFVFVCKDRHVNYHSCCNTCQLKNDSIKIWLILGSSVSYTNHNVLLGLKLPFIMSFLSCVIFSAETIDSIPNYEICAFGKKTNKQNGASCKLTQRNYNLYNSVLKKICSMRVIVFGRARLPESREMSF